MRQGDGSPRVAIPVLLRQRAERDPDGVFIEDIGGPGYTNAEFYEAAIRWADALAALGVAPGDRAAVLLPTTPLAQVAWIGIVWARAWEVPVNPELRGSSLVHALNDSGSAVLITSNELLARVEDVSDRLTSLRHVLTIDAEAPRSPFDVRTAESLLTASPRVEHPEPTLADPYAVIYTSGTTGPSKGVVAPWDQLQHAMPRMFLHDDPSWYDDGAIYSPWPTFHSSGKSGLAYAAMFDLRLVMRERFSVSNFWDDVRRHRCTHVHMLGFSPLLLDLPEGDDDADNPLRRALMLPVTPRYREFERRFGVRVSTGWGMTEIGFPMATDDPVDSETCGQIAPEYEARIVDDQGRDVPDGEIGELIIRAEPRTLLMTEYLGRPEVTANAFSGGWFHTGDALRRTPEGNYYFVDRVADYIRTRGNNVSSLEVEAEVRTHADVQDCACIGVPSSLAELDDGRSAVTGDDDIKIVVVPRPGSELHEEALVRYLIPRMPRFMVPRYVELVDELPRTPTGKVRKAILRAKGGEVPGGWDRVAAGIEVPR